MNDPHPSMLEAASAEKRRDIISAAYHEANRVSLYK